MENLSMQTIQIKQNTFEYPSHFAYHWENKEPPIQPEILENPLNKPNIEDSPNKQAVKEFIMEQKIIDEPTNKLIM